MNQRFHAPEGGLCPVTVCLASTLQLLIERHLYDQGYPYSLF